MTMHEIMANLTTKIQTDTKIDEKTSKQLAHLVESIVSYFETSKSYHEIEVIAVPMETSYNKYIGIIWTNIANDDKIIPSERRVLLYAITQLQQSLWKY